MHFSGVNKIQRWPFEGTVPVTSRYTVTFLLNVDTVQNSSELCCIFYYFIGTGSDVQVPKRHKTSRPSQGTLRPSAFCAEDQDSTSGNKNASL